MRACDRARYIILPAEDFCNGCVNECMETLGDARCARPTAAVGLGAFGDQMRLAAMVDRPCRNKNGKQEPPPVIVGCSA
jgi:hypothetical protein